MSLLKLTAEETLKFVELYKINDCLWNLTSQFYANKQARVDALQNIVDGMQLSGFTINDVRAKIKCLRSTYYLELDKIEKSAKLNNGESIYVPKMEWFKEMHSFIYDVILKRKVHDFDTPSPPKKKVRKDNATPIKIKSETASKLDYQDEDDEFESFGIMVARSLRKLAHPHQSIALKLMSDVLFHAKMGRLNETSVVICTVPRKVISIVADRSKPRIPCPDG